MRPPVPFRGPLGDPGPAPPRVTDVLEAAQGLDLTPGELPRLWQQLAALARAGGATGDPADAAPARVAAGVLAELAGLAAERAAARALASAPPAPPEDPVKDPVDDPPPPSKRENVPLPGDRVRLARRPGVPAVLATGSPLYLRVALDLAREAARVAAADPPPDDPAGAPGG